VIAVDAARHTLITDFGDYSADVINVIPPQKAGRIADLAGAVDHTGWCPIDPVSFASVQVPNLHVIGDACLGGGIPKSASAAHAEAKACAGAIVSLLSGEEPAMPRPLGTCYSVVAPGYGFSQSGIYQPKDGLFVEVDGSATSSPLDAPAELRTREAEQARRWYESITVDSFG
jgi:NADPH-dependent 2,4-dienoyl-CoA reductase/sulfur reductase-like enzyme